MEYQGHKIISNNRSKREALEELLDLIDNKEPGFDRYQFGDEVRAAIKKAHVALKMSDQK